MTTTFRAVYSGGVLHPVAPLVLPEGATVDVSVSLAPGDKSEEEIVRRIAAAKSYREWLEVTRSLPSDDGGYDIVRALQENRRWSDGLTTDSSPDAGEKE